MTWTAALVIGAGAVATVIDVRQRRVPNLLTMGVASTGLALAMAGVAPVTVGGALGGLVLDMHCPIAERFHVGLVHGGVVVLAALVAALLAGLSRK